MTVDPRIKIAARTFRQIEHTLGVALSDAEHGSGSDHDAGQIMCDAIRDAQELAFEAYRALLDAARQVDDQSVETSYTPHAEVSRESQPLIDALSATRPAEGSRGLRPPPEYEDNIWHWLESPGYKSSRYEPHRWIWTGHEWITMVWSVDQSYVRMGPFSPDQMNIGGWRYVGPSDQMVCKCCAADRQSMRHDDGCPAAMLAAIETALDQPTSPPPGSRAPR